MEKLSSSSQLLRQSVHILYMCFRVVALTRGRGWDVWVAYFQSVACSFSLFLLTHLSFKYRAFYQASLIWTWNSAKKFRNTASCFKRAKKKYCPPLWFWIFSGSMSCGQEGWKVEGLGVEVWGRRQINGWSFWRWAWAGSGCGWHFELWLPARSADTWRGCSPTGNVTEIEWSSLCHARTHAHAHTPYVLTPVWQRERVCVFVCVWECVCVCVYVHWVT